MFYIGKTYKTGEGETHRVLMHNLHGKFPVITSGPGGVMSKFTRAGQYFEHKKSEKDLISE